MNFIQWKKTQSIETNTFYHIYNRGINGEILFKQERNYSYFLNQYSKCIEPIAETYAYCLMNNHFHLLVKIKTDDEIIKRLAPKVADPKSTSFYATNQFAKLFNGYTQAINKAVGRTGLLFEEPFRRIEVGNGTYFKELVSYIHLNPQLHGFVSNYKDYIYSSYHSLISTKNTKLRRNEVLNWYGNVDQFEDYHTLFYSDQLKIKAIQEF